MKYGAGFPFCFNRSKARFISCSSACVTGLGVADPLCAIAVFGMIAMLSNSATTGKTLFIYAPFAFDAVILHFGPTNRPKEMLRPHGKLLRVVKQEGQAAVEALSP